MNDTLHLSLKRSNQMSIEPYEPSLTPLEWEVNYDLKVFIQNTLHQVNDIEVKDNESFSKLTRFYSESKKWEKKIDDCRKEMNRPFQDRINSNNDAAREVLASLRSIQELAKSKTVDYQNRLEAEKKEIAALLDCDENSLSNPADN